MLWEIYTYIYFLVSCWILRKMSFKFSILSCHIHSLYCNVHSIFPGWHIFSFLRVPLKTHRLSVNQPVAGGNPQCIGITTERVANSSTGFEFLCAALRKKAPLQMRRDNLFLTEFPMKNRCSYFRISSLSKNSQQLSLALSTCRLIAVGLGLMALSHRSLPASTLHPWLWEHLIFLSLYPCHFALHS